MHNASTALGTRPSEMPLDLSFPDEPPRLRKLPKELAMRFVGRVAVAQHALMGSRTGDRLGILTYHRIASHIPGLPAPLHNVTPNRFCRQIRGLLDRGFQFWSLKRALEHRRTGAAFPPHTALITFDDGFATVYSEAFRTLRELEVPATVFVNTAYLDSSAPFPFDAWGLAFHDQAPERSYRALTYEECREMLASGLIDIGAHTHTHADHRGDPEAFRLDLATSVDVIQSELHVQEVPFAFPFGGRHTGFASEELVEVARTTRVTCALTTEPVLVNRDSDPYCWGRFNAFPWDTATTLAAKLAGWYSWGPKLNRFAGRMVRAATQRSHNEIESDLHKG